MLTHLMMMTSLFHFLFFCCCYVAVSNLFETSSVIPSSVPLPFHRLLRIGSVDVLGRHDYISFLLLKKYGRLRRTSLLFEVGPRVEVVPE